jgi:hypothetical protein
MLKRNGTNQGESDTSNNDNKNNYKSNDDCISGYNVPYHSHFISSSLAWIGGSLFSSLQSNDVKFITLKSLMEQHQRKRTSSKAIEILTGIEYVIEKGGITNREEQDSYRMIREKQLDSFSYVDLLEAPDWLSIDQKDWTFFGPHKSIQI